MSRIHKIYHIQYLYSVQRETAPSTDENWFPHATPSHRGTGFDSIVMRRDEQNWCALSLNRI